MKEDILMMMIKSIGNDFEDVIATGFEEEKELFPYCMACVNFIYELKVQGINANLNYFSEMVRSELYEECKRYLAR